MSSFPHTPAGLVRTFRLARIFTTEVLGLRFAQARCALLPSQRNGLRGDLPSPALPDQVLGSTACFAAHDRAALAMLADPPPPSARSTHARTLVTGRAG
jgi:hypothetical protein